MWRAIKLKKSIIRLILALKLSQRVKGRRHIIIRRVFIIVLDGAGVGALPDADKYGDQGSNTLGHIAQRNKDWRIPNLVSLGLGKLLIIEDTAVAGSGAAGFSLAGLVASCIPLGAYGKMAPISAGKDTTSGHWELAGSVIKNPFPTYPQGFPAEIISSFEARIGRKVLGNKTASGTEIIKELGEKHIETGFPIVYTSADSVFQIAAHEEVVPPDILYSWCLTAREEVLIGTHGVARVIARPFIGSSGQFTRTGGRRDFSLAPPDPTILDLAAGAGLQVTAIGKVKDIFTGKGVTHHLPATGNTEIISCLDRMLQEDFHGIVWATLVDFDMLYGHRNDIDGFAVAMESFDLFLGKAMGLLKKEDLLIITADHGCDPTFPGTDHTREYVPLLIYNPGIIPSNLGIRESFADLGATVCDLLGCPPALYGKSLTGSLF